MIKMGVPQFPLWSEWLEVPDITCSSHDGATADCLFCAMPRCVFRLWISKPKNICKNKWKRSLLSSNGNVPATLRVAQSFSISVFPLSDIPFLVHWNCLSLVGSCYSFDFLCNCHKANFLYWFNFPRMLFVWVIVVVLVLLWRAADNNTLMQLRLMPVSTCFVKSAFHISV